MVSYDLEVTLLVFFLILLILLKIIFALGQKNGEKEKQEKKKEVAVSKSESEKDSYGVAKVSNQPTSYLVNGSKQVDSYGGNFNTDAYLGNYMQDVLVLNEPNPSKLTFENSEDYEQIESEVKKEDKRGNFISLNIEHDDMLNQPTDNLDNEMLEELVEQDSKSSPNSSFMKEYRGLSREMKIYLISKILDKRIYH